MWRFRLLALCLFLGSAAGQQCIQDWIYHEGSCYGFGEAQVTWGDADDICKAFDARLAEIETSSENEWLKNVAKTKNGPNYWLGGTDIFHEGVWLWVSTRQPIYDFSDWETGEPSDSLGSEDCLALWQAVDYRWNDAACDDIYDFICEGRPLETAVG